MKTIILTLGLATAISTGSFSQTKLIALKSHSGSMPEFDITGADNYGYVGVPASVEQKQRDEFEKAVRDSIEKAKIDSLRRAEALRTDSVRRAAILKSKDSTKSKRMLK